MLLPGFISSTHEPLLTFEPLPLCTSRTTLTNLNPTSLALILARRLVDVASADLTLSITRRILVDYSAIARTTTAGIDFDRSWIALQDVRTGRQHRSLCRSAEGEEETEQRPSTRRRLLHSHPSAYERTDLAVPSDRVAGPKVKETAPGQTLWWTADQKSNS